MIYLPYKYQDTRNIPVSLERQSVYKKLLQAINTTNGSVFKKDHYGKEDVVERLKAYSIGKSSGIIQSNEEPKCFYCESFTEHVAVLQVEHFRPKAKVDDIDNNNLPHLGYYWLGIEWTNLLLACPKCNGSNAKGNRFPISGVRVGIHNPITTSQIAPIQLSLNRTLCHSNNHPLIGENSILINPEIEDPASILSFKPNGRMEGKFPNVVRGEENIIIFGLNRDLLVRERDKKWQEIATEIKEASAGLSHCIIKTSAYIFLIDQIIEKIINLKDITQSYTLWGKYINENLESLLDELKIKQRMKSYILHRYKRRTR